jgi:hypothetical protein
MDKSSLLWSESAMKSVICKKKTLDCHRLGSKPKQTEMENRNEPSYITKMSNFKEQTISPFDKNYVKFLSINTSRQLFTLRKLHYQLNNWITLFGSLILHRINLHSIDKILRKTQIQYFKQCPQNEWSLKSDIPITGPTRTN